MTRKKKMPPGDTNEQKPKTKSLKPYSSFSRSHLILFILAFSLIGGYLLYRTFAAEQVVASLEAEQMILPSDASVVADSSASGGKAVKLTANGLSTASVNLPVSATGLSLRVKAKSCSGTYPMLKLSIDGSTIFANRRITSSDYSSQQATRNLSAGLHTVRITSSNHESLFSIGGQGGGCKAELYLDVLTFSGNSAPPTPLPTISFSASPSTIAAGSSSTLTWSSTNADSCNASGAWNGSKPLSGSASTGALNSTAIYNLTCQSPSGVVTASVTVNVTSTPPPAPAPTPPPSSSYTCSKYASLTGSDSSPGTASAPVKTVSRLMNILVAGERGCLNPGTYAEDLKITKGGVSGSPISLSSIPGSVATIKGRMWITDSANFVTVHNLLLDGRNSSNLPSPTVNGDDIIFRDNEVTTYNAPASYCFNLGAETVYGVANNNIIERNRIHNCGELPATNHHHGIYAVSTRNLIIRNNYIYDNADRGIQLYPDAQGSRIHNNVIDGNGQGVIFSGDNGYVSNNNIVENNIISNSNVRWNIEAYFPQAPGVGNIARNNCVWNGKSGNIQTPVVGYTETGNIIADPLFVDRAAKNFQLKAGSPCVGKTPQ